MKDNQHSVAVIGSGLAGLASACTLAARGHQVILLERNPWLGGKAARWQQDGFQFDMGPTILTLPSTLRRLFAEAGERIEDHLDLVPLDPQWRCFFNDGSTLDLVANVEQMAAHLRDFTGEERAAAGYERFMRWSEQLHGISDRYFFHRPVGRLRDMFDLRRALRPGTLRDILSMRMDRTVGSAIRHHVRDARVAQMLDHFTQYVGSAPDSSPAVLCGIAHMQTEEGVWYPRGGIRAVPEALEALARRLGVEIRTEAEVRRIELRGGRVVAVHLADGERLPVEAVVSNCDAVRTHRELLGGKAARRFERRRPYEAACSGVVLYLGLRRRYEHLLHHNFVFSANPEAEFHSIYQRGEPAEDLTAYLCAPARTEPEVAPSGGEALYVLVHTPYLRPHHDWTRLLPDYRRRILDKLKRTAGLEDIEQRIVCEHTLTPQDIHERYHVLNGAIYGLSSHGRLTGAFKPSNRSPDVAGLYLAGGAAHPGPGMPMVLMSGWIAADALDRDFRGGQPVTSGRPVPEMANPA
ncbi:MAG: phytoene desaturase [Verrucomicrobiales bacterium]|nr:phytoene desaturase [Verrucomicrobiales bacterium]